MYCPVSHSIFSTIFCALPQYEYPERDPQTEAKVQRTLKLVLSELSQLVVGFSYCFENEMRQWCNKTPPTLTELGPAFKRTHTLLQQFITVSEHNFGFSVYSVPWLQLSIFSGFFGLFCYSFMVKISLKLNTISSKNAVYF